jgi:hypothetical protein
VIARAFHHVALENTRRQSTELSQLPTHAGAFPTGHAARETGDGWDQPDDAAGEPPTTMMRQSVFTVSRHSQVERIQMNRSKSPHPRQSSFGSRTDWKANSGQLTESQRGLRKRNIT